MEFNLINKMEIEFIGGSSKKTISPPTKRRKVVWIKRTHNSRYPLTLIPVLDENGSIAIDPETMGFNPNRNISRKLMFGENDLATQLQLNSKGCVTTHFTFTSSNTARLMIETKRITPEDPDVDILEGLFKLEENLPPNSLEFTLSVKPFEYNDDDNESWCSYDDEFEFDIFGNGLKLKRNESGSASIELTDIDLPSENWWQNWRHSRATTFSGRLSVNVKVGIAAVTELYKRRFGREPLATEVGSATDLVILVGGNKDKEKGVKCHKSILSKMSPEFEAMFQADMLEAKEGTLEIVDFSDSCIRALIEFAYRGTVEGALKSSEVAVDLLRVADKYEIGKLPDILMYMIWSMPCSWFDVDVALKLFLFGKNAGGCLSEVEIRGLAVLKWYASNYPEQLMGSKECASLCENPRAAMEFVVKLLDEAKPE